MAIVFLRVIATCVVKNVFIKEELWQLINITFKYGTFYIVPLISLLRLLII